MVLPWRGGHPDLPSNKQESIRRLSSLNKKLERQGLAIEYDKIIRDQKEQRIIEDCPPERAGREFYIPHKPEVREEAAKLNYGWYTTLQQELTQTHHP